MSVPGTNVATMLFGNHTGNNNLTLYEKRDTTNMTIVRLKKEGVLGTRISGIDSGDYVNVLNDTGSYLVDTLLQTNHTRPDPIAVQNFSKSMDSIN